MSKRPIYPSAVGELPSAKRAMETLSDSEIARIFRPNDRFNGLIHSHSATNRIALFYHAAYLEAFGRIAPFGPVPPRVASHISRILETELPVPAGGAAKLWPSNGCLCNREVTL